MICSGCGVGELEISTSSEWDGFVETPAFCPHCTKITWLTEEHGGVVLVEDRIPPVPLGYEIKVVNDVHPLSGKTGYVVDKDHDHYRIKVEHLLLWVPSHWVEEVTSI